MTKWTEPGWYDQGGLLPPAMTTVVNNTGQPIPVETAEQVKRGLDHIRDRYGNPMAEEEDVD